MVNVVVVVVDVAVVVTAAFGILLHCKWWANTITTITTTRIELVVVKWLHADAVSVLSLSLFSLLS